MLLAKVKAVPEGFHTITPHLTVRDCPRAIEFYQKAFGAQLRGPVSYGPDGKVMHATMQIGDSVFMLNDEYPEFGTLSPQSSGGAGSMIHLYVENVDPLFHQAVNAGATVKMPLMEQFWGDRYGQLMDPFGHKWSLATPTRDMTIEEMRQEEQAAMARMKKSA